MNPRPDSVLSRVPLLVGIVLLLAIAVGAVIVLATLADTLGLVLAVGALLATTVASLMVVRAELADEEPAPAVVRSTRGWLAGGLAAAAVVMLAVAVLLVSSDKTPSSTAYGGASGAVETVREYVSATAADQAGEKACSYLTAGEQQRVARLVGPHAVCREAFSNTDPAAGGAAAIRAIQTEPATATISNGQARVVLGSGSGASAFVLHRATAGDASDFYAPTTDWRIASGALAVLTP
jgi:hypothetical protein